MSSGWIRLHRKVRDHWLYSEDRVFSKYEAWIDLLMMANYKDTVVLLGNEKISVERGSFITSELRLMTRWKWGKTKVRNFLALLEDEKMILRKTDRKKTTITICNYSVYNDSDEENKPQENHEHTTDKPSAYTAKKDKNDLYDDLPADDFQLVANRFMEKRNNGFFLSPKDEMSIQRVLSKGLSADEIIGYIDKTFEENASITAFTYIEKVIESKQNKITPFHGRPKKKSNLEKLDEIGREMGLVQ